MNRLFTGILLFGMSFLFGCGSGGSTEDRSGTTGSSTNYIEQLNRDIADDIGNPDLYGKRAEYYLAEHDFNHALKDINKAITLDDKNPSYYIILSDIQLLMGNSANCMNALNRAVALDPKNPDAQLKLAKLYLILQNYEATFRVLNELLKFDDYNPGAYFIRANANLEEGDTALAVRDLMKAVDQDQQFYDAYMLLGELFSLRNDPLAEGYLENALRIRPSSTDALYMLGMYYQETEQIDRALLAYDNIITIDSSFKMAPYNQGYIFLVYKQDFPAAVEAFSQAIRIDPDYVNAFFNRGFAYELNGQPEMAYDDYKTTLKLDVNNSKAIEGLNRLDRSGFKKQAPL